MLYEDKILDGRNRYKACVEAGTSPRYAYYKGDDPIGFVIAANLTRRHLEVYQRAMIAAGLANIAAHGSPKPMGKVVPHKLISVDDAAKKMGVSSSAVDCAIAIKKYGSESLIEDVKQGKVPLRTAYKGLRKDADIIVRTSRWNPAIEAALMENSERSNTDICRAIGLSENCRGRVSRFRASMEQRGQIEPYLVGRKKAPLEPSTPTDPPKPRNDLTLRVRTNHTQEEFGYPPPHLQDVEHPDYPGTGRTYMDVHIAKYGRVQHQHTDIIDARRRHENVSSLVFHMRKIATDIKEAMVPLGKIASIAEFEQNITESRREKFEECLDIIEDFAAKAAEYRTKKGPRLVVENR